MDSQLKKDLIELIKVFRKRKYVVLSTILLCLIVSVAYSIVISKKTYTYTSKLYLQINIDGENLDQNLITQEKNEVTNLFLEYAKDYNKMKNISEKNSQYSVADKAIFEQVGYYPIIKVSLNSNKLLSDCKILDNYLKQIMDDFTNIKPDVKFIVVQNFGLYKVQTTNIPKNVVLSIILGMFLSLIIVMLMQLFEFVVKNLDSV